MRATIWSKISSNYSQTSAGIATELFATVLGIENLPDRSPGNLLANLGAPAFAQLAACKILAHRLLPLFDRLVRRLRLSVHRIEVRRLSQTLSTSSLGLRRIAATVRAELSLGTVSTLSEAFWRRRPS